MNSSSDVADFINFKDKEVYRRVRNIGREEVTEHENDDLNIRVIEDETDFYSAFATDIVSRVKKTREKGKDFVAILPVGPVAQYPIAARMINELELSCDHVHTFNMDEYADENGNTVPADWEGSFQGTMKEVFFDRIDEDLRPPEDQIHFPTSDNLDSYDRMIGDLGGADVCYGGIGWCGHIAFVEPHWGEEFEDNLEGFKKQGARIIELHPMTIMQNALSSFNDDWSRVPPKAMTIGPKQILEADHRSFWVDGRRWFVARLILHGPVTPLVPGSLLQTEKGDITLLGSVAELGK